MVKQLMAQGSLWQLMALGSLVSLGLLDMMKGSQWPRAQEGFHS